MQEISNKMKILITYAKVYDMPAEPGRDAMKGCSVHYFFYGENGEALTPFTEWDMALEVGFQRNKVSLDYPIRAKIPTAPGVYWGDFRMVTGGDGKPVIKLTDVEFIEPLDIKGLLDKVAAAEQVQAAQADQSHTKPAESTSAKGTK